MYNLRNFIVLALICFVTASCVSRAGIAEFQVYKNTFDKAREASEPIIAILRNEERLLKRSLINKGKRVNGAAVDVSDGIALEFDPLHAEILSDTADPPFTQAVRGAINVLQSYNEIMVKYAEGAALDALRAEANRLQSEAVGAASSLASAAGSSFSLGPGAKLTLGSIKEAAGILAKSGSRRAFRTELIDREAAMQTLLDKLIDNTMVAYELVTRRSQRLVILGGASAKTEREKINARRKMLAEWVVILRNSKIALNSAVNAIKDGGGTLMFVSGSADTIAEIHASTLRIKDLATKAN